MVNKKTAFIDKRRAATFHLVCGDSAARDAAVAAGDTAADTERVLSRVAVRLPLACCA